MPKRMTSFSFSSLKSLTLSSLTNVPNFEWSVSTMVGRESDSAHWFSVNFIRISACRRETLVSPDNARSGLDWPVAELRARPILKTLLLRSHLFWSLACPAKYHIYKWNLAFIIYIYGIRHLVQHFIICFLLKIKNKWQKLRCIVILNSESDFRGKSIRILTHEMRT